MAGKEVHHIIPISKRWDLRLEFSNLELLCWNCHHAMHEKEGKLQKFDKFWETLKNGESPENRHR